MDVSVASNLDDFDSLKGEWSNLLDESEATIFQSWEWQYTWWKHYGKRRKLFILTFRDKDELLGIAPFFISSTYLGLPLRIISFLGIGPTDYGGFIFKQHKEREILAKMFEYLGSYKKWDVVDLHELPEDSTYLREMKDIAREVSFEGRELIQDASFALTLPGSWDEVLAGLSKKFRWNVSYYTRRLNRDYQLEIQQAREAQELDSLMEEFFHLHQRRWRDKKKPGLFFSKKYQAFHKEIATKFLSKGWLALYFLKADGRAVASLYGFKHKDFFYYYLGGFDPHWGRLSVGTVLTASVIKQAIEDGLASFDFLRGQESYKLRWQAQAKKHLRFLVSKKHKKADLIKKLLAQEHKLVTTAKQKLRSN